MKVNESLHFASLESLFGFSAARAQAIIHYKNHGCESRRLRSMLSNTKRVQWAVASSLSESGSLNLVFSEDLSAFSGAS